MAEEANTNGVKPPARAARRRVQKTRYLTKMELRPVRGADGQQVTGLELFFPETNEAFKFGGPQQVLDLGQRLVSAVKPGLAIPGPGPGQAQRAPGGLIIPGRT